MNVITKKHISRRALLRGGGVSMALPFLTAMVPAATALAKTAAVGKPRLGFVYFPHGAVMDKWVPKTVGKNFDLPPIESAKNAAATVSAVLAAVASGEITPADAGEVSKLIEVFVKVYETAELVERIEQLERMSTHDRAQS